MIEPFLWNSFWLIVGAIGFYLTVFKGYFSCKAMRPTNPILTISDAKTNLQWFYHDLLALMEKYDVSVVSGRLDDLQTWREQNGEQQN